MRFWLQALVIAGLSVGISSCETLSGFLPGGGEEEVAVDAPSTSPANPAPATPDPASGETPEEGAIATDPAAEGEAGDSDDTEAFDDPLVEEEEAVGNVPLELIPSTPPEDRVAAVQQDRPDPFDLLQTLPTLTVPEEALEPPALPNPPNPPNFSDSPNIPGGGDGPIDGDGGGDGPIDGDGGLAPIPPLVPIEPPPPPQPETARAVTVTGVVQIGNVPYAIVNAPNEPHSRYVRSGQLLSNGQVLVKDIILVPGAADPVVVLEEFGISVTRPVGEPGIRPDASPEERVG